MKSNLRLPYGLCVSLWVLMCAAGATAARAQQEDGAPPEAGSRQILPFFPDARAKGQTGVRPVYRSTARRRHSGSHVTYAKPKPRPGGVKPRPPKPSPKGGGTAAQLANQGGATQAAALAAAQKVGVTIWRLRPSALFADPRQAGCRAGGRELGQPVMVTPPVRVSSDTLFKTGDRLRLSLESVRPGYLYVLNREVYADETRGPLSLVFPTRRMRGGHNRIAPGRPVEFPDFCDNPNYIEFLPPRHGRRPVAEQLILLVTDAPLADVGVPPDRVRIPESFLQLWEARWAGPSEEFDLEAGENQAYTAAEMNAGFEIHGPGRPGGRELGQGAPQPQTVFAVNAARPDGVLVTLLLRYG